VRLTRKCQMTVPKHIRQKMGIGPGSSVDIIFQEGKPVLVKVDENRDDSQRRLEELREHLARVRGTGKRGISSDDIINLTRGPFDDVDDR
jgi:AbrB family looped-hinge helix DNA binding protein